MNILESIAFVIVVATGVYFVCLGVAAIFNKPRAARFLESFASSALAHYVELAVRLLVGFAFVVYGVDMPFAQGWTFFGWLLVGTTACLFLVPWRWHNKFARRSVPQAIQWLNLIGAVSFAIGILVIVSALHGSIY